MTHIITHPAQHNLFGSSISSCRKCYITRRLAQFFLLYCMLLPCDSDGRKTKCVVTPDNIYTVVSSICEAKILFTVCFRSVKLEWTSPGRPNGILGGYDVWRRTLKRCEDLQTQQTFAPQSRCSYLECSAEQDFCGKTCYNPEMQVTTHI